MILYFLQTIDCDVVVSVNLFDYLGSVLSYILLAFPIFHGDYDSKSPADFSSLISAVSNLSGSTLQTSIEYFLL